MHKSDPSTAPRRGGLSLLELITVVTIVGIIAAVVLPRIGRQGQMAKKNACHQYRADLNSAIERYYFDHNVWPSLSDVEHPDYYSETIPTCPVDHTTYTLDSTTHRVAGHDH